MKNLTSPDPTPAAMCAACGHHLSKHLHGALIECDAFRCECAAWEPIPDEAPPSGEEIARLFRHIADDACGGDDETLVLVLVAFGCDRAYVEGLAADAASRWPR